MSKILAFFGSDLKEKNLELLQQAYGKGYALLALDVSAVDLARKARLPYSLMHDWIDGKTLFQLTEKAAQCEKKWFRAAEDIFTSDGICWPEFDHRAMHWFWYDAMLAIRFAQAFRTHGIQELSFFQKSLAPQPSFEFLPSDICKNLWEAELPGVAKPYEPLKTPVVTPKPVWWRALSYAKRSVKSAIKAVIKKEPHINNRENTQEASLCALKGKVVLAFNHMEFTRFALVIRQLRESIPGKIAAVILSNNQAIASKIAAEHSIPVINGPPPAPIDYSLGKKFMRGYAQVKNMSDGELWQKPLKGVGFHFEYYCTKRWPGLKNNFYFWFNLWQIARPKVILVSSLQDGESQLPAEAAKRLNIPTFSIPHGAVTAESPYPLSAGKILYGLLTEKKVYEQSGIPPRDLIACRGIIPENEYNFTPIETKAPHTTWRVLVITDTIGFTGTMPSTDPGAQLAALKVLNNPPHDIREKLCIDVKAHPCWPDRELFDIVSDRLTMHLLPPNSELQPLLERTDLVVAVNYYGSALVHALRRGKAVIFFWTDYLVGKSGVYKNCSLFLPAGTLVRTREELWSSVRHFFTDSETARQMRLKAQDFSRKNLDDKSYPDISEVVNSVFSGVKD